MELKQFVSNSLLQIFEGISEAQERLTNGGQICPVIRRETLASKDTAVAVSTDGHPVEFFEFDVAVSVDETSKKEGSISIAFGALKIGGGGDKESGNEVVSRIKFRIPVTFPTAK